MCKTKTKWELCVEFHGHECLGLAVGYRQALYALEALGVTRDEDEDLIAIVETDACGVDGIQVLTGCTLGKGNLIYKDAGKMAMTLANRQTGEAIRIIKRADTMPEDEHFQAVRRKITSGTATTEEQAEWTKIQKARVQKFLSLPFGEIFKAGKVEMPVLEKARLFSTVVCSQCQEPFAESKARLVDGKIVCSDCHQEYSRGW